MQKYINLSSSDWSATGRIYIFGNILDLDFLCSTNAMGDLEKFQYGCNLFSNKQGTIYGFYCSYLQSWLFGSYLQSVNRKRDSAHEDVGGLGSGENLFCQWPTNDKNFWWCKIVTNRGHRLTTESVWKQENDKIFWWCKTVTNTGHRPTTESV